MSTAIETLDGAKLVGTDDGKTFPMGVAVVDGTLKVIFTKPVAWVGLDRKAARAFARRLQQFADTGR